MSSSSVPFFSAERANAGLDLLEPLRRVLDSHWYVLGNEVRAFEEEFAAAVGVEHCVTVANGSDALEIALRGVGVRAGDRVATVANAGFYGSTAIHALGATPLYVDIDAASLTMCPDRLAQAIEARPAAVIVTHLYGQMADIAALVDIAREAGIPLVEDCAQAHGAARNGVPAGGHGDVGCFSFYPTKNLGALGDGGAVVTNDAALATRARQLRQYGWSRKYVVELAGGRNSRLDELQAAVLRTKLPHLERWNEQRRRIARRYNDAFAGLGLTLPAVDGESYVAHLYVVRVDDRERFAAALKDAGIATDVHYPIADHRQTAYAATATAPLEASERACASVISLPCYPGMTDDEIERVIGAVVAHRGGRAGRC